MTKIRLRKKKKDKKIEKFKKFGHYSNKHVRNLDKITQLQSEHTTVDKNKTNKYQK